MAESSPQDDKDVIAPASSTEEKPEAATPDTKTTDEKSPAPSTEEKPKGSMLDAVKAAIEPKAAESPAAKEPEAAANADAPKTDAEAESDELSEAETAALSRKTQSRLKRLNSENKHFLAEVDRLKPKAAEYDAIDGFVRNAGLTNQDVKSTLEIAALAVSDPRQALERIRVVVSNLEKVVGDQLPPELQQRVDAGYLTADDAKALSRSTAEAARANRRAAQTQEQQRAGEAIQQQREATDRTLNSVDTWEKQKLTSDPDFQLKRKDVAELVELAILQESQKQGRPWFPNPEEAIKLSDTALETVNKRYSRFTPKPTEVKPATGGASTRSTAEPKTMMEAIRAAAAS